MKSFTRVLTLLCFALIVLTVSTPPANAEPRPGLRIGISTSTLHLLSSYDREVMDPYEKSIWGLNFGLFFVEQLAPSLALQPEIIFVQKGSRWNVDEGWLSFDVKYQLYYIELPILAKITIPGNSAVKPFFLLGPAPAYLIQARYDASLSSEWEDQSETGTAEQFKRNDLGIIFGGGFTFAAGKNSISIEAQYDLGLINIYNETDLSGLKNRSLSFWLGYCF
jgi:hypothetical protein